MKACAIFFEKPLSYHDGSILQEGILAARIKDLVPDTVLFLEHWPVITCGVKSKPEQILFSPEELRARNIEFTPASRGGAVTFHAPGQVVMYPIIKLDAQQLKNVAGLGEAGPGSPSPATTSDVHGYLNNLEEVAIRTAACFGVRAYRREGLTGAWTDQGKLAAIGVRFKRWVAYHGLSFNVDVDLAGFSAIVPCGLAGEKVTSLKIMLGKKCPSPAEVRAGLARHFGFVYGRKLKVLRRKNFSAGQLPALLAALEKQSALTPRTC